MHRMLISPGIGWLPLKMRIMWSKRKVMIKTTSWLQVTKHLGDYIALHRQWECISQCWDSRTTQYVTMGFFPLLFMKIWQFLYAQIAFFTGSKLVNMKIQNYGIHEKSMIRRVEVSEHLGDYIRLHDEWLCPALHPRGSSSAPQGVPLPCRMLRQGLTRAVWSQPGWLKIKLKTNFCDTSQMYSNQTNKRYI